MKKHIKYVIPFFCFFACFATFGQTEEEIELIKEQTNGIYLETLSQKLKNEAILNKQIALAKGWPLQFTLPDGSVSDLQGMLDSTTPLYVTTTNENSGITSRANRLYAGGTSGLSLHGEGMTAGVWDGDAIRLTHEAFEARAIQIDGAVAPTPTTDSDHATHVTGTIIASNQFKDGLVTGMAYKGNVFAYDWDFDDSEMAAAASNGLLLSNHSYGLAIFNSTTFDPVPNYVFGKYTNKSANWDEIMYNAPFYQIVKSAGNVRGKTDDGTDDGNLHPQVGIKNGYDVLATESTSKNVLVVAAVSKVLDYTGPDDVLMTDFSSWGPTDDGRIKPDIAANGYNVYSSRDETDSSYTWKYGTSMAAPSVTGTLLLLQQHYVNSNHKFMRSATLRALTIHAADEAGDSFGPDYRFGWGLINAAKAARIISNNGDKSVIKENTLNNTTTDVLHIKAANNLGILGGFIEVTLAWTDPKGVPLGGAGIDNASSMLVNDLDLRVTNGTSTFYPWRLGGISNPTAAATQGDNVVDNVEKIQFFVPSSKVGEVYTISISHKGTLENSAQDYSLIVTGIQVNCSPYLTITAPVPFGEIDLQNASLSIEANNNINPGGEAIYHAGNEVLLTTGFETGNDSRFKAYIEGCTNVFERKPVELINREVVKFKLPESDLLGIQDIALELYPNPTTGFTTLYLPNFNGQYQVEILNLLGQRIKGYTMTAPKLEFDTSDLRNGVYLIKVSNGINIHTSKLLKE